MTTREAEDGAQAILMLQQDMNIDLLLLDINMPKIDGFGVLERLNQFRWIEELPVIMISATEDRAVIERCYSLGITDYIRRPFDSFIVQRRVKNTLTLYANQKRLMGMVSDQIYQNEKDSHVMIGILSHIVEFRNSESAQHVLQVQTVTEMLLRKLTEKDRCIRSDRGQDPPHHHRVRPARHRQDQHPREHSEQGGRTDARGIQHHPHPSRHRRIHARGG